MRLAVPLRYHRKPPAAWQAALDAIAPPHRQKSRLLIRWHAGREFFDETVGSRVWQPIERWIIWELIPSAVMSPRFPAVVKMAGPRIHGGVALHELQGVRGLLDLDRSSCDREQWAIYLETGQYARMVWVIQGEHGGHQRHFSEWQRMGLSRRGLPEEPPYPGQLPYAPFDRRVLAQLEQLQQGRIWESVSNQAERAWHLIGAHEQQEALSARRALADWAEQQLGEVLDSSTRAERAELRELYPAGVGRPDEMVDADEALAAYLEGAE